MPPRRPAASNAALNDIINHINRLPNVVQTGIGFADQGSMSTAVARPIMAAEDALRFHRSMHPGMGHYDFELSADISNSNWLADLITRFEQGNRYR